MADDQVNILLVDDRPGNLLALEAVLEDPGYNLVKANSGVTALRHLLDKEFALILLDAQMPAMDGFETARIIREREKTHDIPIIFVTAELGEIDHVGRGYALNAVDYILKPFDRDILRTKVAVLAELHRKTAKVRQQAELLGRSEARLVKLVAERTSELERTNRQLELQVAERTRAMEKLERTMVELERSNKELEQFAYVASHDLQEPLRSISGFLQLLEKRYAGQLGEDADLFIARSLAATHRMKTLIEGLLAYSRVGMRGGSFEPVDCAKVLEQALVNLQVGIEESDAAITHDPMPAVVGDSSQLGQLFQNLFNNAIKFKSDRRPEIHVGATRDANPGHWLFSVRDNGIGIPAEHFERIFVIFQRLHSRSEYPGTGIGLSLCKKIVERHNGRIWVESQPGAGSTFFFTLPAGGDHSP